MATTKCNTEAEFPFYIPSNACFLALRSLQSSRLERDCCLLALPFQVPTPLSVLSKLVTVVLRDRLHNFESFTVLPSRQMDFSDLLGETRSCHSAKVPLEERAVPDCCAVL